ncbi:hypothetical protein J5O08_07975 [Cellulomonas sp. PS-H5]|nr:hypothetical protein [Cellulomonas sp. PS-H5]
MRLYWSIGHDILDRQEVRGWGSRVVERLAADLEREFPEQRGWSRANLFYMRRAAKAWPTEPDVQQAVGRLPWGHVTVLLDRLKTRDDRDWYAARAVDEGWSRSVQLHHIAVGLRSSWPTTRASRRTPGPRCRRPASCRPSSTPSCTVRRVRGRRPARRVPSPARAPPPSRHPPSPGRGTGRARAGTAPSC